MICTNVIRAPYVIRERKIRVAIVGCGRIALKHVEAIKQHSEDLILDSVCDVNQSAISALNGHIVDCKSYSSLDELLISSQADVVTICTPSGLHAAQVICAAKAGRHVITEKPMATRFQDGIDMVNACDEAKVHLFVVKQNRMNTTLQALKKAVENERFGRIYMVNSNVFWSRPQSYYDQAKWRGTWEFDGGALMNQASHYIDLLCWLFGSVESVQAMTATLARNIEAEDTGVLNIKWRSGILGSVNATMLAYKKNFEGSITILGEKGTARVAGMALNEIQHWEFKDQCMEDNNIKIMNYSTDSVYGFGHNNYYKNVIEVIRGNATPVADGRSGLKTLELLIAAYLSARDGRKVCLPLCT